MWMAVMWRFRPWRVGIRWVLASLMTYSAVLSARVVMCRLPLRVLLTWVMAQPVPLRALLMVSLMRIWCSLVSSAFSDVGGWRRMTNWRSLRGC